MCWCSRFLLLIPERYCGGFAGTQGGIESGTKLFGIGSGWHQLRRNLPSIRLRWFGHVQRRPPEVPVRNGVLERVDNVKRGRGRRKLTWDESVKRDLKDWNISKEIALDRSA